MRADIAGHHRCAVGGRLQQRQRQALQPGRQDEGGGVRVQLGEEVPVHVVSEDDPGIVGGQPPQLDHEVVGVARAAGHHQLHRTGNLTKGPDQKIGRLLRHQPAHEQEVAAGLEPEPLPYGRRRARRRLGHPVGDVDGPPVVADGVMVGQGPGDGDGDVGDVCAHPLRRPQHRPGAPTPLGPLVVESVDGLHHPGPTEHPGERSYEPGAEGVVVDDVVAAGQGGERRDAAVGNGVQVLGGKGREVAQVHTPVPGGMLAAVVGPAVDAHLVTPGGQAGPQLLDVVLDAAEGGGHAPLADHRHPEAAHRRAPVIVAASS